MKLILVCGTRPNFIKIAPLMRAIDNYNKSLDNTSIKPILVHTGQHYDFEMSKVFFENLKLAEPDIHLGIGSGTHAEQTGRAMIGLEKTIIREKPDLVIVVGDVNSTLAGALASVKLHRPIAHVEAGLRSHDRAMPEEINRLLTDAVSDYLFTTSPEDDKNLKKEGIPQDRIFCVGDVMIDSLLHNKSNAKQSMILSSLNLNKQGYALLTLHRPSNVDDKQSLTRIIDALKQIAQKIPIVFPVHPRTQTRIEEFSLLNMLQVAKHQILIIDSLGYLRFLNLEMNSRFIMTDSGGIQVESTALNIPCLTLRNNTERPTTISQGTNILVWNDTQKIVKEAFKILDGKGKKGKCPELWDGKTAERIIQVITQFV